MIMREEGRKEGKGEALVEGSSSLALIDFDRFNFSSLPGSLGGRDAWAWVFY
jgi:hypothetical protein